MQGKGARAYNDALQLSHDENTPGSRYKVRKQLHQFVVTQDICIAQGFAKENPHLGAGGGQQIFVMNEPYRVCRRVNILRDYADEKTKLYPRN